MTFDRFSGHNTFIFWLIFGLKLATNLFGIIAHLLGLFTISSKYSIIQHIERTIIEASESCGQITCNKLVIKSQFACSQRLVLLSMFIPFKYIGRCKIYIIKELRAYNIQNSIRRNSSHKNSIPVNADEERYSVNLSDHRIDRSFSSLIFNFITA